MKCVAILVDRYHQPLDQAWRTTHREFAAICSWEKMDEEGRTVPIATKKELSNFEAQLRKMGAIR